MGEEDNSIKRTERQAAWDDPGGLFCELCRIPAQFHTGDYQQHWELSDNGRQGPWKMLPGKLP
ncbi:MAG: hypothetical protein NC548_58215 [Lachnospiraceae bacterium]|nr:hypothetical protein [Lachnospiraceae bacterium]